MRRRWRVQWPDWLEDSSPAEFFVFVFLGWCALGLCAMLVTGVITSIVYGDERTTLAFYIVMLLGAGVPFVAGFGAAVLFGVRWLFGGAIRRVSESAPDLREAYRD